MLNQLLESRDRDLYLLRRFKVVEAYEADGKRKGDTAQDPPWDDCRDGVGA